MSVFQLVYYEESILKSVWELEEFETGNRKYLQESVSYLNKVEG